MCPRATTYHFSTMFFEVYRTETKIQRLFQTEKTVQK
jgi:hypothetical protein